MVIIANQLQEALEANDKTLEEFTNYRTAYPDKSVALAGASVDDASADAS